MLSSVANILIIVFLSRFGPLARRNSAAKLTGTYVACLDCGREFPYDWQEMKVITSPSEQRNYVASLAHKRAAA